jgi:hypothetical protein
MPHRNWLKGGSVVDPVALGHPIYHVDDALRRPPMIVKTLSVMRRRNLPDHEGFAWLFMGSDQMRGVVKQSW